MNFGSHYFIKMGFFSILLTAVCILIAVLVAIQAFSIWSAWNRLQFYKNQGIKTYFYPLKGYYQMFSQKPKPGQSKVDDFFSNFVKGEYDRGVVACNTISDARSVVHLLTSDHIKDFLLKEDLFERKFMILDFPMDFGFLFQSGADVMHKRSIFQKIFLYEQLKNFTPLICKLTQEYFEFVAKSNGVNKDTFTKIDLKEIFSVIIKKVSLVILFGKYDFVEDSIEYQLQRNVDVQFEHAIALITNPLIALAPKLCYTFPFLVKRLNMLKDKITEQKALIAKYMKSREGQLPTGGSTMDRIVSLNTECVRSGNMADFMDTDEIIGTLNLIAFASQDTSQNLTMNNICMMANNPEVRKVLEFCAEEIYDEAGFTTVEKIEEHQNLSLFFKEACRMNNAAFGLFNRIATTDVQIKDITIRKGDSVGCVFASLNYNSDIFKNPSEFQMDRFTKDKEKTYPRYQSIPFGVGKRVCVGRHLGELTVKLLTTAFCKYFEFRKPADVDYYVDFKLVRVSTQQLPCGHFRRLRR